MAATLKKLKKVAVVGSDKFAFELHQKKGEKITYQDCKPQKQTATFGFYSFQKSFSLGRRALLVRPMFKDHFVVVFLSIGNLS